MGSLDLAVGTLKPRFVACDRRKCNLLSYYGVDDVLYATPLPLSNMTVVIAFEGAFVLLS
ncbi:hypothetical protein BDW72DRAFT_164966 [Aspergillus terricola var. indicus]